MSLPYLDGSGRPTLRTVAALAGVHVSTASRALSASLAPGERSGSKATVTRIRRIAEEVGFERNPHGAGLRTSRSNLVGVLVPRLADIVLATIYEGIDDRARQLGYHAFVTNSQDDQAVRRAGAEMLLARRVDGLILGDARLDDGLLAELSARNVPFVLVNRRSGDHPGVVCDDLEGGRLAARHLLERGHRDVAVIAGEQYASTGYDRASGFVETCAEAGIEIPPHRIVASPFDADGGRRAAESLLRDAKPPTALFVVNDFAAIGAMGAARAAGLSVGSDLAVVGYNDIPIAGHLPVPLTSVASPMYRMGERAMDLLHACFDGAAPQAEALTPKLIVRESSTGVRQLEE